MHKTWERPSFKPSPQWGRDLGRLGPYLTIRLPIRVMCINIKYYIKYMLINIVLILPHMIISFRKRLGPNRYYLLLSNIDFLGWSSHHPSLNLGDRRIKSFLKRWLNEGLVMGHLGLKLLKFKDLDEPYLILKLGSFGNSSQGFQVSTFFFLRGRKTIPEDISKGLLWFYSLNEMWWIKWTLPNSNFCRTCHTISKFNSRYYAVNKG